MSPEINRLERALQLYKGLVEVSALINAITDFDELLNAIMEVARRVMDAEASSLFLVNAEGHLQLKYATGPATAGPFREIIVPRGKGISGWVLETGESLLVPDAYADPRFYREADRISGFRTRSIVCVPLAHGGKALGVLQVLNPMGKRAFEPDDLEPFKAYANLAATAIDKLRTFEQQREQERTALEAAMAAEIQNSFLPQTLPSARGLSFAATYRPARYIGGDFYDVMEVGPDEIYFVIGDVSGKGTPAALLMAQALSTLRLIIRPGLATGAVLSRWNEMLCGHTIRGMFITALLGRLHPSRRRIELSSAGHCAPFRLHADGSVEDLALAGSPPLGILPGIAHRCDEFDFSPGEKLCAFTDGLTESFNARGDLLDRAGVQALLAHPSTGADDVVSRLVRGEQQHRGAEDPNDDLTILVCAWDEAGN